VFDIRLVLATVAALCLAGCSVREKAPSPLSIALQRLPQAGLDPQIQRTSRAIYHYIVGELAYQSEDFDEALRNFAKAGELAEEPAPSLHSRLAELYVRDGEIEKARLEIERSLAEDPDNEPGLFLYAGILETLGLPERAAEIYRRFISKDKQRLDAYLLLAGLYAKQERYQEGIEVLEQLAKNRHYRDVAWYQIGHLYEMMRDFDRAAQYYLRVYERSTKNGTAVTDVIRAYLQAGRVQRARSFCRAVLAGDPNNQVAKRVLDGLVEDGEGFTAAVAQMQALKQKSREPNQNRFRLALMEIEAQNYDEALRQLNLVLAGNPNHMEARFYLASVYAATGRARDAVAELMKIGIHDPMYIRARTFAAFVLMQAGDLEEAERVAREAWEADRNNRKVFYYLVSILRDERKYAEAERLLGEAVKEYPNDAELRFQHGVALHDLKKEREALAKMEEVIQMDPDYSDALNYIAYSLAEQGRDLNRALELVKRALQKKPEDAYYIDTLGWVYYQMGDFESAEKELSRAVGLSGKDVVILEHYGDVLTRRGKFSEARRVYELIVGSTVLEASRKKRGAQDEEAAQAVIRAAEKLKRLPKHDRKYPAGAVTE